LTSSVINQLKEIKNEMDRGKYLESVEILEQMIEKEELTYENKIRTELLLCWGYAMIVQWRYQIIFPDMYYANKWLERMKYLTKEIPKLNNLELSFDFLCLEFFSIFITADNQKLDSIYKKMTTIFQEIKKNDTELEKKKEGKYLTFSGYYYHMISMGGVDVPEDYMDISRDYLKKAMDSLEKSDDPFLIEFGIHNILFLFYRYEGKIKESKQMVDKTIECMNRYGNDYGKAHFLGYYINIYYSLGDKTKLLEYILKRKELWDKLEMEGREAAHAIIMSHYYELIGEREEALKSFKSSLDYYKKINAEVRLSFLYMNIGTLHLENGDLTEAEEYILRAYTFLTKHKYEYWWDVFEPMARVYMFKGELEKAKDIYEEALAFYENRQSKSHILFTLRSLSLVLWQMGKKEEALEYAWRSYKIASETDSLLWKGYMLANLIFLLIENDELDSAESKLDELNKIISETNDRDLERSFRFSEARILLKKENEKDRLRAEVLLEGLLKEKLDYQEYVNVVTSLTELLFLRLYETDDKDILSKIQSYVLDLFSLASSNQSFLLIAESLLLQSKLALLELNVEKAKQLLEKAIKLAKEKGLKRIAEIVEIEKSRFSEDINHLKNLDKDTDFGEKLDVLQIKTRVNGFKKSGVTAEKIEETEFSKKLLSIKI
jgi:tetratricopeptide (TPR) repeat protein